MHGRTRAAAGDQSDAADLAVLTEARNRAILAAGHDPERALAWAYMANPFARALMETAGLDLGTHVPERGAGGHGTLTWTATITGWRVGYMAMRMGEGGEAISVDAGNGMTRIVVVGEYPDTIVQTLVGTPIRNIVGLPHLHSSEHGSSPIRDAWCEDGRLSFTVSFPLAPLADAPEGTDTAWLKAWLGRHAR